MRLFLLIIAFVHEDLSIILMRIVVESVREIVSGRVHGGVIRDSAESRCIARPANTERGIIDDPCTAVRIHQAILRDVLRGRLQADHRVRVAYHLIVIDLVAVAIHLQVSVGGGTVDLGPPVAGQQLLAESRAYRAQERGHEHVVTHVEHLAAGRFVGIVAC